MKKFRRLLTYIRAIVSHVTALVRGVIGSTLIASPAWIRPLLSVKWQPTLDKYTILQPSTYTNFAIAFFVIALFYAGFLVWNEGCDELERLGIESPQLVGEIAPGSQWSPCLLQRGGTKETWTTFDCHISIRNTGTIPSIVRDFQLRIPSSQTIIVSMGIDPEVAELIRLNGGTLPNGKIPIVQHVSPIVPGGEWRGSVPFTITRSPDQLHGLAIEILFRDVRGLEYSIPWRFP